MKPQEFCGAFSLSVMQRKYDILISYSRSDVDFADDLYRALELQGLHVWMDRTSIPQSSEWEEKIWRALRESAFMLLIISQASMDSQPVKDEIATAINLKTPIWWVKIEEPSPDTFVPLRLQRLNGKVVLGDRSQDKLQEIVRDARAVLNEVQPAPTTPKQEANISV